jgi:hypothetical protein
MTGPDNHDTRPISVAELLARNGTIGSPPPAGGRRRRRRGNTDAVTVAELTGEIPIVGAEDDEPGASSVTPEAPGRTNGTVGTVTGAALAESDMSAEEMLPDPVYTDPAYTDPAYIDADDAEDEDEDAELAVQERHLDEFDEPPSYLHAVREPLFGGRFEDGLRRDQPYPRDEVRRDEVRRLPKAGPAARTAEDHEEHEPPNRMQQVGRGALIVLQSMLAVAFGAGLFIAFDELWKWNNIVALVLSVLVILGLVVGVRIVRKTEDIASTLIAVAVGALVTLGPLALLQSG